MPVVFAGCSSPDVGLAPWVVKLLGDSPGGGKPRVVLTRDGRSPGVSKPSEGKVLDFEGPGGGGKARERKPVAKPGGGQSREVK